MSTDKAMEAEGDPDEQRRVHEIETVMQPVNAQLAGGDSATVDTPAPAGVAGFGEFCHALVEIGLIGAEELETFAGESKEGVLGLSRALVKAGALTPYQAAAVYQKKSRGLLIGNYLILDKLGQGGMGVVFKARHRRLGQVGALKILPPSFARDQSAVMRFRREVEAAGRLRHPNLVAAQDADEDRGVHFLVMEYVEGRDLDRVVRDRGPMPVVQAIDCLIQAACGLEAAHAAGIVHRDIKPGNLMLENTGSVRVLDLGLARIVDAANPFSKSAAGRLTQSGMYMGTIDYMAPEQAEDSHRVDHRADIYSLGCTLYYLLTGKEPFPGDTVLRRLMAHMERPAPSLRIARPDVPAALDLAFLKMMAKRPQDRPASMTEVISLLNSCKTAVADAGTAAAIGPRSQPELKIFNEAPLKRSGAPKAKSEPSNLTGPAEHEGSLWSHELNLEDLVTDVRPEAPPPPLLSATRPAFAKAQPLKRLSATRSHGRKARQPLVIVALVAVAAVVVLGGAFVRFGLSHRGEEPPPALAKAAEPDLDPSDATTNSRLSPSTEITTTIFDGKTGQGWMLCDQQPVPPRNIQPDGLNPHGAGSHLVVYEKTLGDFVLDFDYKLTKGCNSGVFLRVSDLNDYANTGIEVALDDTTGHGLHDPGAFYDLVAPSENAQKAAGEWNHMTITAKGPEIAVVLNGKKVSAINLDEWDEPGKRPDGSSHKYDGVAIGKMPRSGYIGLQDHGNDCWFKQIVLKRVESATDTPRSRSLAPKDQATTANRSSGDPEPYVETARFAGHTGGGLADVAISPDGRLALSCGGDRMVRLWEIETRRGLHHFAHDNTIWSVAISPDGRRALSASHDQTVRLWDLVTGGEIFRKAAHESHVKAVAFFPDGRHALSGGDDDAVIFWDLQPGEPVTRTIGRHDGDVQCLAISRDGRLAVSGGDDRLVRVWDCDSWRELAPLKGHKETITAVAFSPDGRRVVTGSADRDMILWDFASRKEQFRLSFPGEDVATAAVFTPDGRRVVAAGNKGQLAMWDLDSRALVRLGDGPSPHTGVALLPEGRGVLTSDDDGIVRIWSHSRVIARARELTVKAQTDMALTEYGNALHDRSDDVMLRIERGRLLAGLGRSSEADADFALAAARVPEYPQLFLDAGWWVAGAYPPDRSTRAPIESDPAPEPSSPPAVPGTEPRRWQNVGIGPGGKVDLGAIFHAEDSAAYALAIVYSASERDVAVIVSNDDQATYWLNGKHLLGAPFAPPERGRTMLTTMHAGRNTILVKVVNFKGPHGFNLRICGAPADFVRAYVGGRKWAQAIDNYKLAVDDDPNNRSAAIHHDAGRAYAELGRWNEAAQAFKTARVLDPANGAIRYDLSRCYLALNDIASFQPLCSEAIEKLKKNADRTAINDAVWAACLAPKALPDYARAIDLARTLGDAKATDWALFNTYGALLYRGKKYHAAINFLNLSIKAQKGKGSAFDWVFVAMARHQLKQPGDQDALKRAVTMAHDSSFDWRLRVEIRALLEEARQELSLPAVQ